MNLNYGNPNREYLSLLKEENYLDTLLTELKSFTPPNDDSPIAQAEIANVIELTENLSADPNAESRYIYYDHSFIKYITSVVTNAGVNKNEAESLMKDVYFDTFHILVKLKYYFQRVRPNQLAFYLNMPLHPYNSIADNTPSYPSGHCFQSKLLCEVLGNKYPKYYSSLMKLNEDICFSRLALGLHYQSDVNFANYCADLILNHPDFKKKYKL
jgi:hypothetical protein